MSSANTLEVRLCRSNVGGRGTVGGKTCVDGGHEVGGWAVAVCVCVAAAADDVEPGV
jgi:hypothetical protein